jgi:hypothetical protein
MWQALAFVSAMQAYYAGGEPPTATAGPEYVCPSCEVGGRAEGDERACWCCGSTEVTPKRAWILDQHNIAREWPAPAESVDRLIERS